MSIQKKLSAIFGAIAAVAVIVGSFYVGFELGAAKNPGDIAKAAEKSNKLDVDFSLFWDAIEIIKSKYVNINEVEDQQLLYGAVDGVVKSLGDDYSTFFEPSDAKKFEEDINGNFGGIGAEIGIRDGQLVIIAPLKGNPAEAAGLKPADKILEINGTSTVGIALDKAVKQIRGEVSTPVKLLIMRDSFKEPKEFTIVRQIIKIPTLDWKMLPGSILYVQLYNFNSNAPSLFYEAALGGILKGARGIVLDLRNNPGGYLDVAINIAGWFFDRGAVVVREQFYGGVADELRANGNGVLKNVPVVVIVNNGSASASEILAGALRDNRQVKIIGEKTFGKGTVQELQSLKDGSSMKISTAEWLTPNGGKINRQGLAPDYAVKITDEHTEKGLDPQFDKAVEVLRTQSGIKN